MQEIKGVSKQKGANCAPALVIINARIEAKDETIHGADAICNLAKKVLARSIASHMKGKKGFVKWEPVCAEPNLTDDAIVATSNDDSLKCVCSWTEVEIGIANIEEQWRPLIHKLVCFRYTRSVSISFNTDNAKRRKPTQTIHYDVSLDEDEVWG